MNSIEMQNVIKWFGGQDTGMSSKAIATHMTTGDCDGSYPHDPADLGRCLRLLENFPQWKPRMAEMSKYGEHWRLMAARWDELEAAMFAEVGINWEKGRSAPETYALMKSLRG